MSRTHTRLYAHIVWSTFDRAPIITPAIRDRIYPMMQRHATNLGAEVIAIGGIEDHVHVLARFPSRLAISELVQRMKGASSYLASQVMGELFRWQGSYGAFTVSERGVDRVRAYVLNQEAHHRGGTTHPLLEITEEQAS
ncbi:MAG: IS200/IS605 family transposase [Gemmatimonadetes bacterium]|nr:IS200/IS605 family transposase [Gemmatimonadota bacterium]